MPSDPRVTMALAALATPIADFRAIVDGAISQGEALLADQAADAPQRTERAGASLGRFAEGRIDAERFASLFALAPNITPEARSALDWALRILRDVRTLGDAMFVAEVLPGGKLAGVLDAAFSSVGRAFGAVLLVDLVRGGRYEPNQDVLLYGQPFRSWNRAERRFAPPLVVRVDGADLLPGALMDYADGREKIVLVVRGASPPAPLARCITPGTFVLQTVDGSGLDRLATFEGPAVAALVPEGAAVFTHDPAGGAEPWQRLSVRFMPEMPKRGVGGQSAWQMTQDLRVISTLATTPFIVPGADGKASAHAMGASDATDRIAAWLLGQAAQTDTVS